MSHYNSCHQQTIIPINLHMRSYTTTGLNESVKLNLPSASSLYHLKSTFIQKKLSSSHTVRCCSYSATLYNLNHYQPHSKFFVKFVITKSIQFSIFSMNILFCGPFNFQLIKRRKVSLKMLWMCKMSKTCFRIWQKTIKFSTRHTLFQFTLNFNPSIRTQNSAMRNWKF